MLAASSLVKIKMSNTQIEIAKACDEIKSLLLEKNVKYGDSALDPCRVFSQASAIEQILVRIDDKLSRIKRGAGLVGSDEDVLKDLTGYLILLQVALGREKTAEVSHQDLKIEESVDGYLGFDPWGGEDIEATYGNAYHTFRVSNRL